MPRRCSDASQARQVSLRGVMRIELAHDVYRVAAPADRLAHDFLGAAPAVHLGGVDEVHAEVEAQLQRAHFLRAPPLLFPHVPRPHAQARHPRLHKACTSVPYWGFTRVFAPSLLSALM
jgi:hypothetical protein